MGDLHCAAGLEYNSNNLLISKYAIKISIGHYFEILSASRGKCCVNHSGNSFLRMLEINSMPLNAAKGLGKNADVSTICR